MAATGIRRPVRLGLGKSQGLIPVRPFVLFCAGEDSGDILGEGCVRQVVEGNCDAFGAGGARMQRAGLVPVVPFDDLPVNGFWDVLKHSARLSRHLKTLESFLQKENCKGLVAVDYPGFNLKLMQMALKLGKRVVYLEPPQIWAWKPHRVKLFLSERAKRFVELRSCYDIQIKAYERFGLTVRRMEHPFEMAKRKANPLSAHQGPVLLFPGSRLSQLRRNIGLYGMVASKLKSCGVKVKFVASRKSLVPHLERGLCGKFPIEISPSTAEDRFELLNASACILSGPGTVISEAAIAGTPCIAASRIEPLTYWLGKRFLSSDFLCLSNIEAERVGEIPMIPEIVEVSFSNLELHAKRVLTEIQKFISFKICS